MKKPHKHYDIIHMWILGHDIQGQSPTTDEWIDVPNVNELGKNNNYLEPSPLHPEFDWWPNWRIK